MNGCGALVGRCILIGMNGFKIFNGNEGEYDTREDKRVSTDWPVGVSVMLVNLEDDVKIFKPLFRFGSAA